MPRLSPRTSVRLPAAALAVIIAACGGDDTASPPPPPAAISVAAGNHQEGVAGSALATALAVRVTDASGQPTPNVSVTWSTGDGSLSPTSSSTDADGRATTTWTLGTVAGGQTASASVSGVGQSATFTATAEPGPVAKFTIDPDTIVFTAILDTVQLEVAARDQFDNPVPGGQVTWTLLPEMVATVEGSGEVVSIGNGIAQAIGTLAGMTDTVTIVVDNLAPEIVIQEPTVQTSFATTAAQVTLSGLASDNVGLVSLGWSTDRGASGTLTPQESWTLSNLDLAPGDTRFTIIAHDRVGHADTARVRLTRNTGATYANTPTLEPSGALVGSTTQVRALVSLSLETGATLDRVDLVEIDDEGQTVRTLGQVADNGVLANGDEILGDGVFSGYFTLSPTSVGDVQIRAVARLTMGGSAVDATSGTSTFSAYAPLTGAEVSEVLSAQSQVVDKIESSPATTVDGVLAYFAQELTSLESVASVSVSSSTTLDIVYDSGVRGGISITVEGTQGGWTEGGWTQGQWTQGRSFLTQALDTLPRPTRVRIPLRRQTVGSITEASGSPVAAESSDGTILNRKVLIYDPSATEFSPYDKGDEVRDLAEDSKYDLEVTHLKNAAADVAGLLSMPRYGMVVIDTHGGSGKIFLTGEVVDDSDTKYESYVKQGQLRILTHVVVRPVLGIFSTSSKKDVYAADASFFSHLAERFPQSVIFASYCQGAQNPHLSSAFLGQGAQTYLGWDESFYSNTGKSALLDVLGKFVGDAENIGKAYTAHSDPKTGATLRLVGSAQAHYSTGLVNGDFETGDLSGWTSSGDGRVITQLGPLAPAEGGHMGIISTGLGFTKSSGSIEQTFILTDSDSTLEFRWNFLSEEFLEYVGSQYQDHFAVRIKTDSGTDVLFTKTIDDIAGNYTLTKASPGIVFDQGDVYQTGWLSLSLDVSSYRGQTVTLIFETGDVGDSIYDTAVLLDAITIKP